MNREQSNARLVRSLISTSWRNSVKISREPAEKTKHQLLKFFLAQECLKQGLNYHTEAVFKNNQRADFIIEETATIIEIISTEKKKRFLTKKYPLKTIPLPDDIDQQTIKTIITDLKNNPENADYLRKLYINTAFK